MQDVDSQLRLEIAHLTQQLAASRGGDNSKHEAVTQAEQAAALAKASAAILQQDLARIKSQRDAAWEVFTVVNACELETGFWEGGGNGGARLRLLCY